MVTGLLSRQTLATTSKLSRRSSPAYIDGGAAAVPQAHGSRSETSRPSRVIYSLSVIATHASPAIVLGRGGEREAGQDDTRLCE